MELISKKDLLKETGISYGQLYRWKRERLIPEDWFQKRASFTGQETFFPREQTLQRVNAITTLKDEYSLPELAQMFSPETQHGISREDLEKVEGFKPLLPYLPQGNFRQYDAAVLHFALTAAQKSGLPPEDEDSLLKRAVQAAVGEQSAQGNVTVFMCENQAHILFSNGPFRFDGEVQVIQSAEVEDMLGTFKACMLTQ